MEKNELHLTRQRLYDRLLAHGYRVPLYNFRVQDGMLTVVMYPGDIEREVAIMATDEYDLLRIACTFVH